MLYAPYDKDFKLSEEILVKIKNLIGNGLNQQQEILKTSHNS